MPIKAKVIVMKKDKLKKLSVSFAIVFFLVLALLTYFSDTIDTMLLPKVKTTSVITGTLSEDENPNITKYLIPLSAISGFGEGASVYVIQPYGNEKDTVISEVSVNISTQDEMYAEVTSDALYGGTMVIYSSSKNIYNGDRVYIDE